MPLYEYQCKTCGRTLEKRQKFSDAPLTVCPFCSGPLEQLISAPAVQFKGGGWYADGYGSKSAAKSGSTEAGAASSGSSESGASGGPSESKSAPASSSDSSSSSPASSGSGPSSSGAAASK